MAQLDGVAPAARESGDVAPPAVAHEERAAYASQVGHRSRFSRFLSGNFKILPDMTPRCRYNMKGTSIGPVLKGFEGYKSMVSAMKWLIMVV